MIMDTRRLLKEIFHEICLILGLKREPKVQAEDNCSVRDCWGEMADRIRKDGKS